MAVFTIGDLHLSLSGDHSMEVFPGWEGYVQRIQEDWHSQVKEGDTVVLVGDTSWGLGLEEALPDFRFLDALPGRKLLIKGNHDYWWSTRAKMEAFFLANGLNSLEILHNNSVAVEGLAICGSRGWIVESEKAFDAKIVNREAARLELSLAEGEKLGLPLVAFLHYPPVYRESKCAPILETLQRYHVQRCYYGHIHASGYRWAIDGFFEGIQYRMVSSDYRRFRLLLVEAGAV